MTSGEPQSDLATRVGGSAFTLVVRRFLMIAVTAATTAVLARTLGVADFGTYGAALALVFLVQTLSDFGFSSLLSRELAQRPADRPSLIADAIRTQSVWSVLLTAIVLVTAASGGLDDQRTQAVAVLALGLPFLGLSPYRTLLLVTYRTRDLTRVDVLTTLAQSAAMVAAVVAGGGVLAIAAITAAGMAVPALLAAHLGRRVLLPGATSSAGRGRLVRGAAPLGVAGVLSTAYFTIDMALLGWLVPAVEVGQYAAAVKILNILVAVPSAMLLAGLPGLSEVVRDRAAVTALVARMWHWLMSLGAPLCVGVILFADPLVTVAFGPDYDDAVPLVRILGAAGLGSMAASVLTAVVMGMGRGRLLVILNAVALALNVTANLVLVPVHGALAAAWITVGTEVFIVACAGLALRGHVTIGPSLRASWRPALAVLVGVAAALPLLASPGIAIPVAAAAFVGGVVVLRSWPAELGRGIQPPVRS